ncbi:MAG: hypothetical protein Q9169_008449, partial [Polycauliona sp. 2 TL-2023]
YVPFHPPILNQNLKGVYRDLMLGKSFGALENDKMPFFIRYSACIPLSYQQSLGTKKKEIVNRNIMESAKYLGILKFSALYPAVQLALKLLEVAKPSIKAKRVDYMEFTRSSIEKRMTLLFAGSETTASAVSGATYHLLRNPSMLHRLQSDIRTAYKAAEDITLRAVSNPGRLPYLEAVIQESLRCFPPVPALLPRIVGPAGGIVDGYYVPKNVSVGVHQWSAYRSGDNFANPDTFDPNRWLADAPTKYCNDKQAALQPFSLGPRGCIGKGLAYFEMRSILIRILWHFDLELEPESRNWAAQKEYSVWDKQPLWVVLRHRKD